MNYDRVLLYVRELTRRRDALISEILKEFDIACGEGCAFCCYGVPLWVKLPEALLITEALNELPIKDRKSIHSRLRKYARAYEQGAKNVGYAPDSPIHESELDRDRVSLICGLEIKDIPCPLLGEESLCQVYGARPLMCRLTVFKDRNICEKDWREPLSFLWKNEIEPFIGRVKEEFFRKWSREERELRDIFSDLPLESLESLLFFLPSHLRFDPIKKSFKFKP